MKLNSNQKKSQCIEGDTYLQVKKIKVENLPQPSQAIEYKENTHLKHTGADEYHKKYLAKLNMIREAKRKN